MMANQTFTLNFDAKLNVSQMKGALGQIQSTLNGLHLPDNITKNLQGTFNKLSEEVKNFEVLSGKDITGKADFTKLTNSANKIVDLFTRLKSQISDIGALSDSSLAKLFPDSTVNNIQKAGKALSDYQNKLKSAEQDIASASKKVEDLNSKLAKENNKTVVDNNTYKQIGENLKQAEAEVAEYTAKLKELQEIQAREEERLGANKNKSSTYRSLIKEIEEVQQKLQAAEQSANKFAQQKANTTTFSKHATEVQKLQTELNEATTKLQNFENALAQIKSTSDGGGMQELINSISQLTGLDMSKFSADAEGVGQAIQAYLNQELERLKTNLNDSEQALESQGDALRNNKAQVDEAGDSYKRFEDQLRDVSAVKSRIQYFFGLNNAINLVKRAIRGAVDTVKELDKAMTETAVVTNYTISDMWKQLPDYTKRANELGVTTKDAYEAATLYYQQGLNTEQAAALSTETLKMARIAGLEAADATDRMTNALRGFNMELNAMSAQRVDDVYSQLAAMSASNVDEISTAMTKVASLAHSANMEFETTAAFLAQIIETTRESAETAGTALKTVVARFSEVKKLYDMDELKGKDEEGQTIDVNKVSSALRTAGIDLNKYFLGEVGLDDIFMELASKWDSLTSVQQRYIATQAAGSRQQSRFIALMQDYARTQQLVSAAYNANGASARQFEKTQESLQSKLARLKNAWDQFLMGLTNNAVIKTAVDLLTGLLNVVNNLTEAFGTGVGSILKWITVISAFSGIKSLFAGGGLIDKGLMTVLNGTGIGNAAVKNGLLSGLVFGGKGKIAQGLTGEAATNAAAAVAGTTATRTPLIFGSGSLLSQASKGLWGKAKDLGYLIGGNFGTAGAASGSALTGSAGMAAGLTGVATALGAVAAAVGIVVAGYQAWLRLTPEGHLKQAKQLAEVMNDVATNTQKNASEFKKATQNYQEYDNAVKSATSTAEYQKAVTDRTNYVSELIKNNPNFAQYVKASSENGQYTLTINQKDLEKASEEAADYASKAAADASFSNALVAGKQADVYQAQLRRAGVNLERGTIYDSSIEAYRNLTGEELAKYSNIQRQIEASRAEEASYAQQAFSRQLEKSGLSDDITNLLSNALAKGFSEDEYLSKVNDKRAENWWSGQATRGALEAQYYSLYGQQADASMKRGELARAVAQAQVNQRQQDTTDQVVELVKTGNYDDILKAIAGEIDFSEEDMAAANGKLQKFADVLGQDISEVQNQIRTNQKARQEIKKSNQANIFEQALKSGYNINQAFADTIKGLDFDQLNIVSDIINQAAGKVGEQTFQSLFDTLPEMSNESLQEIQSFFNNFSLDNPITALEQLNNKIEEVGADSYFGTLLEDIKETNKALFESSNLVQSFLLSDSYEQLSDSIEEVTKNNKKLNGKNIEDMAENCHELDTLLQEINEDLGENIDSAQALAEAINLIGEGSLAIDQITDSLLAALGAGESFESLIGNVQQWIEDFDKGTDLTEGTQHITSVLEEAGKYVESWQFGNEPLQNIYDHIFGEGAYNAYMKENWGKKSFDQLETEIGGEIQRISSMAENEGLGALQFLSTRNIGIVDNGNNEFSWDLDRYKNQENPVQTAIQDVATQLGVTEDAARAFIESWASHMWDLRAEWNDLNFTDAMTAFSQELGNQSVITEAELDALIAKTGKTKEEILSALTEIRGQGNVPIVVSWQDENGGNLTGQDLIDKFNKAVDATAREDRIGRANPLMDYSNLLNGIDDVSRIVKTELGDTLNTLDFDTLHSHLVDALKLTPAQATEIADHISEQTGQKLSKEIKVPVKLDDGTISTETKVITATTSEGLQAGIDAAMQAANYALVAEQMAEASDFSTVGSKLEAAIKTGADTLPGAVSSAAAGVSVTIPVYYEAQNPEVLTGGGAAGGITVSVAKGGQVNSYASGSAANRLSPGVALTGEEGPEIVWNKDKGYAYITGEQNPQFQNLQPGDRVFNASETKKILNGAANGGLIDSYASGGWKPPSSSSKSGGGKGSGSGGKAEKDKTPDEWKNDLDWLYNLMEDIAELERDQKAIEEQYEDLLQDQTKTGGDLYRLLVKQLGNLYTQLNHQTFALEKREQEMREFMDITNDQDQYLWYNWEDRTLEIDWDAIDQITDEEQYKHVKELIDEAEEIQDKIDDADDSIMDITNQIQELENIWRDTFIDFEDRVLDAIIKSYQQIIDNYSELNDTLNNSNTQILDSLQKQISLERQIRDNTKTEEEISDDEARLAYLRRDTSGGNELAALQLERELADQRESYEDTLVDQAISRLQEDNDAAAQQRERQIEIMQAQLDYQSENGEFNAYISELLTAAMGADGELLTNSDLVTLLKEQENWDAMSDVSKQVWDEELNGTFKEVAAFLLKQNAEENGTYYTALTAAVESVSSAIGSYSQAMVKLGNTISSMGSSGGGYSGGGSGGKSGNTDGNDAKPQSITVISSSYGYGSAAMNEALKKNGYSYRFAKGGLSTSTGPAWLDGTPQEPEYVLNARQTDAFLKLADVLPSMMNGTSTTTSNTFGATYVNLSVNLESVSPDYDVDRMVDLVKDKLYDAGSYRNVNSLSFLR